VKGELKGNWRGNRKIYLVGVAPVGGAGRPSSQGRRIGRGLLGYPPAGSVQEERPRPRATVLCKVQRHIRRAPRAGDACHRTPAQLLVPGGANDGTDTGTTSGTGAPAPREGGRDRAGAKKEKRRRGTPCAAPPSKAPLPTNPGPRTGASSLHHHFAPTPQAQVPAPTMAPATRDKDTMPSVCMIR